MIEHGNVDATQYPHQVPGKPPVLFRWPDCAAGVIVGEDQRCRPVANGDFHDAARMYMGLFDGALAEEGRIQDPALRIEAKYVKYLFRATGHEGNEVFGDDLGVIEPGAIPRHAVVEVTPRHGRKQRQEGRGLLSHSLDGGQIHGIGFQYARETAEAAKQLVGDGIGIPALEYLEQDQFQDLMVLEMVQFLGEKPIPQSIAVSAMKIVQRWADTLRGTDAMPVAIFPGKGMGSSCQSPLPGGAYG